MHSTYSANYSVYRQGYRYFPRNLDFDSATTLTGDFYQACKQLIKDKTPALACEEGFGFFFPRLGPFAGSPYIISGQHLKASFSLIMTFPLS
jgi:hypothetical protein